MQEAEKKRLQEIIKENLRKMAQECRKTKACQFCKLRSVQGFCGASAPGTTPANWIDAEWSRIDRYAEFITEGIDAAAKEGRNETKTGKYA